MTDPAELVALLEDRSLTLVTAESLTAGMVASRVAEVPGASGVLWGGFVTYREEAKIAALSVEAALIARAGVVSEAVAAAMAAGALRRSGADCAVATTGAAGPSDCGPRAPVGTVCVAVLLSGKAVRTETYRFVGDRAAVRHAAAEAALDLLFRELSGVGPGDAEEEDGA